MLRRYTLLDPQLLKREGLEKVSSLPIATHMPLTLECQNPAETTSF